MSASGDSVAISWHDSSCTQLHRRVFICEKLPHSKGWLEFRLLRPRMFWRIFFSGCDLGEKWKYRSLHKSTASTCLESASDPHHHMSHWPWKDWQYWINTYSGSCVSVVVTWAAAASSESRLGSRKAVVDFKWLSGGLLVRRWCIMARWEGWRILPPFLPLAEGRSQGVGQNRIDDDATVSAHQKKERNAIPHSMGRSAKTTTMYVNPYTKYLQTSATHKLTWCCHTSSGAAYSLVPRPLPLIKMCAGRGSGGMTRFLTDPRQNAGVHSIAIVRTAHNLRILLPHGAVQKRQRKWYSC